VQGAAGGDESPRAAMSMLRRHNAETKGPRTSAKPRDPAGGSGRGHTTRGRMLWARPPGIGGRGRSPSYFGAGRGACFLINLRIIGYVHGLAAGHGGGRKGGGVRQGRRKKVDVFGEGEMMVTTAPRHSLRLIFGLRARGSRNGLPKD